MNTEDAQWLGMARKAMFNRLNELDLDLGRWSRAAIAVGYDRIFKEKALEAWAYQLETFTLADEISEESFVEA